MPAEAVMPVLEEEVCAKVVQMLKERLASAQSTADQAAVVRVDGKYVANFRFHPAAYPRETRTTYYFDRGFTRVIFSTK